MTTQNTDPAHTSRTHGRITLEVALRFKETGRIWLTEPESGSEGTLANPLATLLPMALANEDAELVGRYPGDSHWQHLTFMPA